MPAAEAPLNSLGTFTVEWYNSAGMLTDPSTVQCIYRAPGGASTIVSFPIAGSPIVKDAVGKYHLDVPLTTPGRWTARWLGTGTLVAATADVEVDVLRSTS